MHRSPRPGFLDRPTTLYDGLAGNHARRGLDVMNMLMTRNSPRSARSSAARRGRLGIGSRLGTRRDPIPSLPLLHLTIAWRSLLDRREGFRIELPRLRADARAHCSCWSAYPTYAVVAGRPHRFSPRADPVDRTALTGTPTGTQGNTAGEHRYCVKQVRRVKTCRYAG